MDPTNEMAAATGYSQGSVDAWSRSADFDPRGRFNREAWLPESAWSSFRAGYDAGFSKSMSIKKTEAR